MKIMAEGVYRMRDGNPCTVRNIGKTGPYPVRGYYIKGNAEWTATWTRNGISHSGKKCPTDIVSQQPEGVKI